MISLKAKGARVVLDSGELVSYIVNGHEYIHQKGSPGWRSSDTEMFPIIGPTAEANFQVQTPRDIAIQDQHGLLREMVYELIDASDTQAVFQKKYTANTRIKNSKYPETGLPDEQESTKEYVFWPYDFIFTKTFLLSDDALEVVFKVDAPRDTPFMLGYHPAFKLHTAKPVVVANENTISLDDILAVGSRAYQVADCKEITLKDTNELHIKTEGFSSFMLWTEVPNMLCIEPITFYPYTVSQDQLHLGFDKISDNPKQFKVLLKPL